MVCFWYSQLIVDAFQVYHAHLEASNAKIDLYLVARQVSDAFEFDDDLDEIRA